MSKFLKVIVNLFLVCAILVGAAILVPPLMGISTTVIDSSSMDTNLPVGSVTYARDVDVTDIATGDKLIYESDARTYVYVVEEADAGSGRFLVQDTRNASGQPEEITLRNVASEVVITVPFIGYVMMAMHSMEGLIIIGLVVLFIIILFILSELWKKPEEDEDADEESAEETVEIIAPANEQPYSPETPVADTMSEEEAMALAREELVRAVTASQIGESETAEEVSRPNQESEPVEEPSLEPEQIQEEILSREEVEEEIPKEDLNTFIPVPRLTAEELLKKAEASGEQPNVVRDEKLGVTILDYSNLI